MYSPTIDNQLQRIYGQAHYESFKAEIMQLLQQPGVTYIGPVSHTVLEQGFRQAGFL